MPILFLIIFLGSCSLKPETEIQVYPQLGHSDTVSSAVLSGDGRYLVSLNQDNSVKIWNAKTGVFIEAFDVSDRISSMVFSPDNESLITVSPDGVVSNVNIKTGKIKLLEQDDNASPDLINSTNSNGKFVSVMDDNTIILWDAATGKKIASFISFDDNEWICITPDGYYNASPRGDERLNVRIGTEVYGMDQFSAVFFQAETVQARLEGAPDPAVTQNTKRRITAPPAISISAPQESDTGRAVIDVSIKDNFHSLYSVQIVINGRLLGQDELGAFSGAKKLAAENTSLVVKDNAQELQFSIPVALDAGSNRVEIIAANRGKNNGNTGVTVSRKSIYIVNTSETGAPAPDVWVLAIGSNGNLNGRGSNLKYAVNNAKGIQALFESQRGKRYRNVHTRIIADGEKIIPTRENIISNISDFFGKASANDVLILYLSGHGEERKENDGYYFLPQAVSLDDIGIISEMPGRKLIFIDSCFSGGADDKGLARSLKNQSTVIITSSQKDERSWEGSAAVPYGFFTAALISGINGEAAVNNEVRLFNLGEYVYSKVMLLSGGMQHPYVYAPEGFYGFVIANNN